MKILMLGNSFTFFHKMPMILANLCNAEVTSNLRGGARLSEQLNPETELGAKFANLIETEKWDYVVLQEQSNAPALKKESFQSSADKLCEIIKSHGAKPVFYATWAYKKDTEMLASTGLDYETMFKLMYESYHEAADRNGAIIADVGKAFFELSEILNLYEPDAYHPSETGSAIAAAVLSKTILEAEQKK